MRAFDSKKPTVTVIGAGVSGLMAALLLERKNLNVQLVDENVDTPAPYELPYICSSRVSTLLERDLPEIARALAHEGARKVSIAEILRFRFPGVAITAKDESTSFLCFSRSLLQRVLLEEVKRSRIELVRARVSGLLREGNVVNGVELGATRLESELTLDTTGAGSTRSAWLEKLGIGPERFQTYGPRYVSLAKFYRTTLPSSSIQFDLASGQNFRGGVYPLEGDRFAIALVVPEQVLPEGLDRAAAEKFFAEAAVTLKEHKGF
ncbi:MAG: FAD-dependent oxidoreductase, partial [Bdellovibrionota bacterium]